MRLVWIVAGLLMAVSSVRAQQANEQAFIRVWTQHIQNPTEHEAAIKACTAYIKDHPGDALVPVSQTIAAWHLLKMEEPDKAAALLKPYLKPQTDNVSKGAAQVAKAWQSRIDLIQIREALQFFYRRKVGYPRTLGELVAYEHLPDDLTPASVKDRFGNPWQYRLAGFKKIPGMLDQKYAIESSKLGDTSELSAGLDMTYAGGLLVKAVKVRSAGPSGAVVEFQKLAPDGRTPVGGTVLVSEGLSSGDMYLAFVGKRLLVVNDVNHWAVVPRPGP